MFCSSCGTQLEETARFCKNCGAATGSKATNSQESSTGSGITPSPYTRSYKIKESQVPVLAAKTAQWLELDNYEVQILENLGVQTIQIRKRGTWRRLTGMSTALAVQFTYSNETLKVEIGQAHWASKVATGTVSLFVLWPLAVTTAYGVYSQLKVPEKILSFIDKAIEGLI